MRVVQHEQLTIGEVDVSKITFDPTSRDDIPKILRGLQHLYMDPALRASIFELLARQVAPRVSKSHGRPGMTLWTILVCGVIRLDLNIDYDRLHELVNHHNTIREMLGHGACEDVSDHHQTLKDNVALLTPTLLDEINQLVVRAGHGLVKRQDEEALRGRGDSFVVETNVHYPTDINLLFDAMRKIITLSAQWCEQRGMSDWRQHAYHRRQIKRLMRSAQHKKRARAQSPEHKEQNETLVRHAHHAVLDCAQRTLDRARQTLIEIEAQGDTDVVDLVRKEDIEGFMAHAVRQIDHIRRRVILGEVIGHGEKVFSLFEPHTEWISKGKAGVPMELGLKVCILEDQHQCILHHQVMQNQSDDQVCVEMVVQAKQRFAHLNACSFDKGFHGGANQIALKQQLDLVALPRKGKLTKEAQAVEQAPAFARARRAHSAVESAINALEVHGLDRCPDHGIDGFKRYVALAVLARNIHRIGALLWQRDEWRLRRSTTYSDREMPHRRAA